jgi:xanthine dehydrogenase FAD-binding subunit
MFDVKEYYEASSVEEAVRLLAEKENAKIIAGGTDLLIRSREGKLPEACFIGIGRIKELNQIEMDADGTISIGPTACFSKLENDEFILSHLPYLADAVGTVGGPQVRNKGTIGGNICNGAPSADSATTLFCLNATLQLRSLRGVRQVPITEFYLGPGRVVLESDEILEKILIKKEDYQGFGGKYIKFSQRKAMDIATLGCMAMLKGEEGCISELRLAYGVAAPTPVRCPKTEELAKGLELTEENITRIAESALSDVTPRDSWRGSKSFREHLVKENAKRAIRIAVATGGDHE